MASYLAYIASSPYELIIPFFPFRSWWDMLILFYPGKDKGLKAKSPSRVEIFWNVRLGFMRIIPLQGYFYQIGKSKADWITTR